MAKRKYIRAIFTFSKSIPALIADARAFKKAITTAPGNTFVNVPPALITALENNLALLTARQAEVKRRTRGTAPGRDLMRDAVVKNIAAIVMKVQREVEKAANELAAIAIIKNCGLRIRKPRTVVLPDIAVKRHGKIPGLLQLISKAAHKNDKAAYEWQMSRNGITFSYITTSTGCRTTWQSNVAPGTKLYFRKRIILNKQRGATSWSQTVNVIVI